jgi:lathosterol oxidase
MLDVSTFLAWYWPLAAAHVGLTAVAVALGVAAERSPLGRARRIQSDPVPPDQQRRELLANLRFVLVVPAALAAVLAAGAIHLGPDTLLRGVLTFAACSLAFDAYYYLLHRAMHTRRLMPIHRHHHLSRVTGPLTGQSMSTLEMLGWIVGYVGVPWLLSQVAPLSLVGYLAYLLYNVFGNIFGHANVELGPRSFTRSPTVWLVHPYTFHALHHARFIKHFGFGSTFMDRLGHTEWPDWVEAYEQVMAGTPLHDHGKLGPPR